MHAFEVLLGEDVWKVAIQRWENEEDTSIIDVSATWTTEFEGAGYFLLWWINEWEFFSNCSFIHVKGVHNGFMWWAAYCWHGKELFSFQVVHCFNARRWWIILTRKKVELIYQKSDVFSYETLYFAVKLEVYKYGKNWCLTKHQFCTI